MPRHALFYMTLKSSIPRYSISSVHTCSCSLDNLCLYMAEKISGDLQINAG